MAGYSAQRLRPTCQSTRTHNSRRRLRRSLLRAGHLHVKAHSMQPSDILSREVVCSAVGDWGRGDLSDEQMHFWATNNYFPAHKVVAPNEPDHVALAIGIVLTISVYLPRHKARPKRTTSNAADKPRWTEPPQLKRGGCRDRGLQVWHADACANYGRGFAFRVAGRRRFRANVCHGLTRATVCRDCEGQLLP